MTTIEKQIHASTRERIQTIGGGNHTLDDDTGSAPLGATAAPLPAPVQEALPTNLAEAYKLLKAAQTEYDSARGLVRSKSDAMRLRQILARRDRARKHCFDLQQGLPVVPPLDADQQSREKKRRLAQPMLRVERIAHLKNLVETNAPTVLPVAHVTTFDGVVPERLALSPRDLALADEGVRHEVAACVKSFRAYAAFRLEMESQLDPVLAEELARNAISAAKTPEELTAARAAYTDATEGRKGQAGAAALQSAKQAVLRAGEPCKAALVAVLEAVKAALDSDLSEAKIVEGDFFIRFGMRWQKTPISERITNALAEVKRLLAGFKSDSHAAWTMPFNPNNSPLITFLGVRYDE